MILYDKIFYYSITVEGPFVIARILLWLRIKIVTSLTFILNDHVNWILIVCFIGRSLPSGL